MGFKSKCSIWNRQVIYIEKSKLNIADMWLIPLDHVTYIISIPSSGLRGLQTLPENAVSPWKIYLQNTLQIVSDSMGQFKLCLRH